MYGDSDICIVYPESDVGDIEISISKCTEDELRAIVTRIERQIQSLEAQE